MDKIVAFGSSLHFRTCSDAFGYVQMCPDAFDADEIYVYEIYVDARFVCPGMAVATGKGKTRFIPLAWQVHGHSRRQQSSASNFARLYQLAVSLGHQLAVWLQ